MYIIIYFFRIKRQINKRSLYKIKSLEMNNQNKRMYNKQKVLIVEIDKNN